jgi:hypothetical protein
MRFMVSLINDGTSMEGATPEEMREMGAKMGELMGELRDAGILVNTGAHPSIRRGGQAGRHRWPVRGVEGADRGLHGPGMRGPRGGYWLGREASDSPRLCRGPGDLRGHDRGGRPAIVLITPRPSGLIGRGDIATGRKRRRPACPPRPCAGSARSAADRRWRAWSKTGSGSFRPSRQPIPLGAAAPLPPPTSSGR